MALEKKRDQKGHNQGALFRGEGGHSGERGDSIIRKKVQSDQYFPNRTGRLKGPPKNGGKKKVDSKPRRKGRVNGVFQKLSSGINEGLTKKQVFPFHPGRAKKGRFKVGKNQKD